MAAHCRHHYLAQHTRCFKASGPQRVSHFLIPMICPRYPAAQVAYSLRRVRGNNMAVRRGLCHRHQRRRRGVMNGSRGALRRQCWPVNRGRAGSVAIAGIQRDGRSLHAQRRPGPRLRPFDADLARLCHQRGLGRCWSWRAWSSTPWPAVRPSTPKWWAMARRGRQPYRRSLETGRRARQAMQVRPQPAPDWPPEVGRLRQRPRHQHPPQRRRRDADYQHGVWGEHAYDGGHKLYQVYDRPFVGGSRRAGGADLPKGVGRWYYPPATN